jgi:DNA gyrase inhibitor GyrI/AraC-like DNA-binding protein
MDRAVKKEYCQSCGMPLRFDVEEYLGTNADSSRSDEYCYYCLKDGKYTVDIPIEEMVNIWVKYTDKYNEYSATNYTPQELRTILNKRMPTLKRWRQIETTRNIHFEAISRVKSYIDKNLFKDIDGEQLARTASLSLFHFRRIFRTVTGENIGSYIQRLRLEYVAHLLISTNLSINKILEQTNYQTIFSLSKAFKKHFGISMTPYRKRHQSIADKQPEILNILQPEIKKLNNQKALCYPVDSIDPHKYMSIWKKIIHYGKSHLNSDNYKFISLSMDNPLVTPTDQHRFYLGIITNEEIEPKGKFCIHEIPKGLYAVLNHKGDYSHIPELYKYIYEEWLHQNGYSPGCPMSYEVYLNSPRDTDITELLTEIYIPIEKH